MEGSTHTSAYSRTSPKCISSHERERDDCEELRVVCVFRKRRLVSLQEDGRRAAFRPLDRSLVRACLSLREREREREREAPVRSWLCHAPFEHMSIAQPSRPKPRRRASGSASVDDDLRKTNLRSFSKKKNFIQKIRSRESCETPGPLAAEEADARRANLTRWTCNSRRPSPTLSRAPTSRSTPRLRATSEACVAHADSSLSDAHFFHTQAHAPIAKKGHL